MAILFWRGRTNKKHFRDRYIQALTILQPLAQIRSTGDLEVELKDPGSGARVDIWLGRAYDEFVREPKNADEIIRRHLTGVEHHLRPSSADELLGALVPMIKDRQWLEQQRVAAKISPDAPFDPWIEEYNGELVVAYAEYRASFRFVARKTIESLGKSTAELHDIALRNLRRLTPQRTVHGNDQPFLVGVGGNFEASVILDDELWDSDFVEVDGALMIGVPDRDSLVVTGVRDPDDVFKLAAAVDHLHRSEPYPISPQLFERRDRRFVPIDTSDTDDEHPIPDITVIDIQGKKQAGATLVVVIASPLRADARSIYRLFRKLNGYLRHIQSPQHIEECGKPSPATVAVEVSIHPESDPEVLKLLEGLSSWVGERGASLVVKVQD